MQTSQMWLVAHLSETQMVSRVEVVLSSGKECFVDTHPRRQLSVNIDVWSSFGEARDASLKHFGDRIRQLRYLRDMVTDQSDPTWHPPTDTKQQS